MDEHNWRGLINAVPNDKWQARLIGARTAMNEDDKVVTILKDVQFMGPDEEPITADVRVLVFEDLYNGSIAQILYSIGDGLTSHKRLV